MKTLKGIVTVLLVGLVLVFAWQNTTMVQVNFLVWSVSMPRALLVILLLVTGILVGWIVSSVRRRP